MAYLVGEAELLAGTDAGGRERRRDRRSCQGALHCGCLGGVLKSVQDNKGKEKLSRVSQTVWENAEAEAVAEEWSKKRFTIDAGGRVEKKFPSSPMRWPELPGR